MAQGILPTIINPDACWHLAGDLMTVDRLTVEPELMTLPAGRFEQQGRFMVLTNASDLITLELAQQAKILHRAVHRQINWREVRTNEFEPDGHKVTYEVSAELAPDVYVVIRWWVIDRNGGE